MGLIVVSAPIIVFFFINMSRAKLHEISFFERYGSLYVGLKPEFIPSLHTVLFLLRRLVYAFAIVFMGDVPLIQSLILNQSSFWLIIFTLHYQPMETKQTFYFELFNEGTVLLTSYVVLVFTLNLETFIDPKSDLRDNLGWAIVAFTLISILVNWTNLIITLIIRLIKIAKLLILKIRLRKKTRLNP